MELKVAAVASSLRLLKQNLNLRRVDAFLFKKIQHYCAATQFITAFPFQLALKCDSLSFRLRSALRQARLAPLGPLGPLGVPQGKLAPIGTHGGPRDQWTLAGPICPMDPQGCGGTPKHPKHAATTGADAACSAIPLRIGGSASTPRPCLRRWDVHIHRPHFRERVRRFRRVSSPQSWPA
jgi:hypothetical protein